MTKHLLYCILIAISWNTQILAQPLTGEMNRTPNAVYYLSNSNFGNITAPTITVSNPTTCGGTGTITINWNKNISGTVVRAVGMHGGLDYSNNIIAGTGGSTLSSANGYTQTFTNLAPGTYTFGLYRDPFDDNLTTDNSGGGKFDDYSIDNWNSTDGDQQRCAVFGVNILPVNSNNLTSLTVNASSATDCVTGNGTISISGLRNSSTYNIALLVNGSYTTYTSTSTGTINITGLLPGIYPLRIRRSGESCFRQINTEVKTSSLAPCYVESVSSAVGTNLISNGDFGTTTGTLPTNSTSDYTRVTTTYGKPADSEYKLDNSTDYSDNGYNVTNEHNYRLRNLSYPTQNRHIYACFQNSKDHTGSVNESNGTTNGYMMLVNANYKTDRVVEISSLSLTAGRAYKFTFWAKNLQPFMPKNKNNATALNNPTYQPIIPKLAITLNGRIYQFSELGITIEPSTYTSNTILDQMGWENFTVYFTSPVTSTNNSIGIYNFQQGGFGNDFLIDDISMYQMVQVTGSVYDDANGMTNSLLDGVGINAPSQTPIFAYLVSTTGIVIDKKLVNADGSFLLFGNANINYTVRISTTEVTIGNTAPSSTNLPTDWISTAESYGTNNSAGSGIESGSPNGNIALRSTGSNIDEINFGINKRPTSDNYSFSIASPAMNSVKALTATNSLDSLSGADFEDGAKGKNSTFKITSVAGLNGNTLFYDANNNGAIDNGETLAANSTIATYDPAKLKVRFTGLNSTSLVFNYTSVDAGGLEDLTPATYTITWITPVPVELIYFNAEKDGITSLLTWATASEINNSHFEVLRSVDAINWTKIGEVTGNGTTQQRIQYQFVDKQPLKVNYYRLRQVDFDGQSELTQIKQVNFDAVVTSILSYPNPTADKVVLNINKINRAEAINILVTDITGRTVVQNELIETKNETIAHSVDLSLLQKGMFIIHVVIGEEKHSIKINKI